MESSFYSSPEWRSARDAAIARDGGCLAPRLLGAAAGACSPPFAPLHVHHLVPLDEGGALLDPANLATVCEAHHPVWEALARFLRRRGDQRPLRCPHRHVHEESRRLCEERLRREFETAA